jgi:type IV pilus assembly protein PilE
VITTTNKRVKARRSKGFTLIELMIAVAIISLLSMIALPSFMDNIRKSKRVDAQTALTRTSTNLERFFSANTTYTVDLAQLGLVVDSGTGYSDERNYVITVAGGATGIASSYTVTATADAASSQSEDTGCTVLTINSLGQRTPNPTTSRCW